MRLYVVYCFTDSFLGAISNFNPPIFKKGGVSRTFWKSYITKEVTDLKDKHACQALLMLESLSHAVYCGFTKICYLGDLKSPPIKVKFNDTDKVMAYKAELPLEDIFVTIKGHEYKKYIRHCLYLL